jgi:hypothetical protein
VSISPARVQYDFKTADLSPRCVRMLEVSAVIQDQGAGKILNHLFFESRDPPMAGNPLVKFFPPVPERDHATPPRPPCEKFRDAHARKPVFSGGGAWQSYSVAERGIANGFGTFGTRKIDWTGR